MNRYVPYEYRIAMRRHRNRKRMLQYLWRHRSDILAGIGGATLIVGSAYLFMLHVYTFGPMLYD